LSWLQVAMATGCHGYRQGMCIVKEADLQDGSRQDDVGTQRTLGVQGLLDTVVSLGQGHGERGLGVHLHNNNNQRWPTLLVTVIKQRHGTLQHDQQLFKQKLVVT